jgi:hypothetical protein
MTWLLSLFFGCSHRRQTFPQTVKGRTYRACLDCGREFSYSWQEMRIVEPQTAPVGELQEEA